METLWNIAQEVAEESLKKAAIGVKEYVIKEGLSEVSAKADLIALGVRGVGYQNKELQIFALKLLEKY